LIVLSLTTSQMSGGAALIRDDQIVGEFILASRKTHSRRLMAQILRLLEEADLSWDRIDLVAVDQGPGSFTGLRIGISTAKGIAMAKGIGTAAVPSLDVMAENCRYFRGFVSPVIDARRGQVYTAFFWSDGSGSMHRIGGYRAVDPDGLLAGLKEGVHGVPKMEEEPVLVLGDGLLAHREALVKALGTAFRDVVLADVGFWAIRPSFVGLVAARRIALGEIAPEGPEALLPLYCRLSEAEEKLRKANP